MSLEYNRSIDILWRTLLWIFGKWFMKTSTTKKNKFISQQTFLYIWVTDILKFYEDLFCTLKRFVLSLKNSHYAYIPPYMHKTLSTLGNEKEQKQIKFYGKSSVELIFFCVTKNLKIIYFTCLTGRVLKK